MAFLEINGIKKSFGKTEVLKGIDVEMQKGEVLAVIGSSGSGKTTLLRCINFLEIPDEGKIAVAGETVFEKRPTEEDLFWKIFKANVEEKYKELPEKQREKQIKREIKTEKKRLKSAKKAEKQRENLKNTVKNALKMPEKRQKLAEKRQKNIEIGQESAEKIQKSDGKVRKKSKFYDELREKRLHFGLVFQQFNLFPHYNVLKNVTLAAQMLAKDENSPMYGESDESILTRACALLEKVGLSDKASSYPCELSGGQQQRVAIARALALNPDILCFDEPTSALDPELTGEVLKVIKNLKSGDRTMIIVTHEMDFAKNVADKVLFMAGGVVEEYGLAKEVFENPRSEKLRAFLQNARESV